MKKHILILISIVLLSSCLFAMIGCDQAENNDDTSSGQSTDLHQIYAYCDYELTNEEIEATEAEIKKLDGVESVTRTTKDEALQNMKELAGEYAYLYDDINEENNPLSDRFIITYTDEGKAEIIAGSLKLIEGIRKVMQRLAIPSVTE